MQHFYIRIAYGKENIVEQFSFATDNEKTAEKDFDKAVKAINKIYKSSGRFSDRSKVINHFKQYGFYTIKL